MAFGAADRLRLGRAVDAVMLLGQVEPDHADRAIGPGGSFCSALPVFASQNRSGL